MVSKHECYRSCRLGAASSSEVSFLLAEDNSHAFHRRRSPIWYGRNSMSRNDTISLSRLSTTTSHSFFSRHPSDAAGYPREGVFATTGPTSERGFLCFDRKRMLCKATIDILFKFSHVSGNIIHPTANITSSKVVKYAVKVKCQRRLILTYA